jgi:hypothetical protein
LGSRTPVKWRPLMEFSLRITVCARDVKVFPRSSPPFGRCP